MSNTPSDDGLFELIKEHFDLDKRPFDTVIDRKTGRFHDAARYRDFASAVLAKWGTPQPVVREPLGNKELQAISLEYSASEDECTGFRDGWRFAEKHYGITQKGGD